ncbi:MAG: hypothetical protein V3S01_04845, partial [Dehalococcoidia bacterium]
IMLGIRVAGWGEGVKRTRRGRGNSCNGVCGVGYWNRGRGLFDDDAVPHVSKVDLGKDFME